MTNILVTGAAGFIAGHLYEYLAKGPKYTVRGIDKYDYAANKDFMARVPSVDCADWRELSFYFDKQGPFDVVIHAAAHTHNDRAIYDPFSFAHNNVIGTVNVLEACRRYKVPRVLLFSTDEVLRHKTPEKLESYEDEYDLDNLGDFGSWKLNRPYAFYRVLEEDFSWTYFDPASSYSASKLSQELFARAFIKTHGMNITTLRPSNTYGPRQFPEKLLPVVITKALKGEKIPVYGHGQQWRDYMYVDDLCRAIDLILNQSNPAHLYHIAANDERQNIETVKTVLRLMNKPESLIEYVDERPGHDWSYSLDCFHIKELGWKPQVTFEDGLLRTIAYYESLRA